MCLTTLTYFTESELYSEGDQVAYIQWRLLRYTGRSGGKEEWQHMAIKVSSVIKVLSFSSLS